MSWKVEVYLKEGRAVEMFDDAEEPAFLGNFILVRNIKSKHTTVYAGDTILKIEYEKDKNEQS